MKKTILLFFLSIVSLTSMYSQKGGTIRGSVYNAGTGEPIIFGTVVLSGTGIGANTDEDGFFSIGNVPAGNYLLVATYVGFDSASVGIALQDGYILTENLLLKESSTQLLTVDVSARKEKARSEVQISKITVSSSQIKSLPGAGGQTDVAQFLPVLPGIISSGDQGGQIYIRGGSPVQNRILLDGMTIYNPFHSIGFFSVFETETIKTVDVLTAGFNAEYGGRVSAIVDIKTREGNKKRLAGLFAANPFQAKALFEGPIKKFEQGGGSISFLLTAKHSYIDKTSPWFYSYAVDTSLYNLQSDTSGTRPANKLPFTFADIYGKVSFVAENGSKLNLFGFNFIDEVDYAGVAKIGWDATGGGLNFTLIPSNSNLLIGGAATYSVYNAFLQDEDDEGRASGIKTYNVQLDFTYFGLRNELKYGFEVSGLDTDFRFRNFIGNTIKQDIATTELAGFVKYKQKFANFLVEPSLRVQFYPSVPASNIEPRFGVKWLLHDKFRVKAAGGYYSQNLIGSVSELDIVNLFVGFLAGTDERVLQPDAKTNAPHRLQKAIHAVIGLEADLTSSLELNFEPYYKRFTQLIQLNRNKLNATDPNFVTETGETYGLDLSLRYAGRDWFLWSTYSLAFVNRDDGNQVYPTIFDRRHNVNILGTYKFGEKQNWEASMRWNLGSGFPFTQTQGFFNNFDFSDGLDKNPLTGNGNLGILLDGKRNAGRLPYYHRLDMSIKYNIELSGTSKLELVLSATNLYNRQNMFYYDRVRNRRIDQLPVLPGLGVAFHF